MDCKFDDKSIPAEWLNAVSNQGLSLPAPLRQTRSLRPVAAPPQLRRHYPIEPCRRAFRVVVFELEAVVLKIRRHSDLLPVRQVGGCLNKVGLAPTAIEFEVEFTVLRYVAGSDIPGFSVVAPATMIEAI